MISGRFDVIVIGAGIGGCCVAALLSHSGYRVLVAERRPIVGGRCSTIDYHGFKLTTGVIGMSQGGLLNGVFNEVGAPFTVVPHRNQVYRVNGRDYYRPPNGGLEWLLREVVGEAEATKVMSVLAKARNWYDPDDSVSFRDWMAQYITNQTVHHIFQTMLSMGLLINTWEVSARTVIRYLGNLDRVPVIGCAPYGNIRLMDSLLEEVRNRGGEVWTQCRINRIKVINERAAGVVLSKNGREMDIDSPVVVCNAGPKQTVRLAGEGYFPESYLKKLAVTLRPAPIIWLHTAINYPDFQFPGRVLLVNSRRVNLVICPSFAAPDLAPKGKHLMVSGSGPISSLPPFDLKNEIALHILDLSDNFPEFTRYGEILHIGCYWGDWPGYGTWAGYEMPQRTPVENLYNVGDAVGPLGVAGNPAAAQSARLVAQDIRQRVKPGSA